MIREILVGMYVGRGGRGSLRFALSEEILCVVPINCVIRKNFGGKVVKIRKKEERSTCFDRKLAVRDSDEEK
jgi:hypothetical protein